MGSRVRLAAAACLVASGLFVGGVGGALAFAYPGHESGDTGETPTNDSRPGTHTGEKHEGKPGNGRPETGKPDTGTPDDGKPRDEKPDDPKDDDPRPTSTTDPKPTETTDPKPTETTDPKPTETEVPPTEEPEEPGTCEDEGRDDCGPGLTLPAPAAPGLIGGGGGGGAFEPPSGRPEVPAIQLPPHVGVESDPSEPGVVNAAPGVGIQAAEAPLAPITMPVIAAPPAPLGPGGGAPSPSLPGAPRGIDAQAPAGRPSPPAEAGRSATIPASSYRSGYRESLRSAQMSRLLALAVPGVAGMLLLTAAGGLVGYRQAKAGHAVRTGRGGRFVN